MTVREPTTQRLQAIESELARLRSIVGQQPGLHHLPQQVRVARTVKSSTSYPSSGDTFAVIFRDEEFVEAEGSQSLDGDDQTVTYSRFARTIPSQFVNENTEVLVAEIDGQHYIIATITETMGEQAEYQADCFGQTVDIPLDEVVQGKLYINNRAMLRLARPEEEADNRRVLEIAPGPDSSVLYMEQLIDGEPSDIVWTDSPRLYNLGLWPGGWVKFNGIGSDVWLGVGSGAFSARHKLPPAPFRSGQYLIARAVSGSCVQWDWFGPGKNCLITAYDCTGTMCQQLQFQNGLLVADNLGCDFPAPAPDIEGCPELPPITYNPCIDTTPWEWQDGGGTVTHAWENGSIARFADD